MKFQFKVGIGNQELDVHVIGENWKLKVGIENQNGDWNLDLKIGVGK